MQYKAFKDKPPRHLNSFREWFRKQAVARIKSRSQQTVYSKPSQRLVTEAVYRPPVRPSRILYHQKKQAYQRVKLRPNHRPKRCKPTTDWRTQAKETHYKRLAPVWASKVRHYSDEYNPSVRPHLDVKLRNDNYHPSALDNAAISTLELIKTRNNFNKRRRRSSVNKIGSLCDRVNGIHRERVVSHHPSVVPSLWETDRYQSNRRVQDLCDKLGNLTDGTRHSIYPISNVEMTAIYKRYLNHRLNLLRHCHGGKEKYTKHTYNNTLCVFDTGASIGLTPYRADFIDYLPLEGATIKDISKVNKVLGVGTVMWKLRSRRGDEVFIPCVAYHMPECDIRLMSPQCYFQTHGGHAEMTEHMVTIHLPGVDKHIVEVPIDKVTNLPAIMQPQTSKDEQLQYGPHLLSTIIANTMLLDDIGRLDQEQLDNIGRMVDPWWDLRECNPSKNRCYKTVADESNKNLTGPQRELLQWHWKLCTSTYHVQELMRERHYINPDSESDVVLPPILPTKHATSKSCPVPKCLACQLSKQKLKSTGVKTSKTVIEKDGVLKFNKYEPGDLVFSDQFNVNTPGRPLSGYGREGSDQSLHGGTLFTDAASNYVYVECQSHMGAGDTVLAKTRFEQLCWDIAGVNIKGYHSDNGVYTAKDFRDDCVAKDQTQSFSGVGAKHQNAVAERNIQTICYWARHMMVHAAVHWPANNADNIRLWPFAIQHAVWLFNRTPNRVTGLTPLEVLTRTKSDHRELRRAHVWGSPAFVLDPRLQDGKKIPKWNKRSRRAQFLGFSPEHSSSVALVRHLQTNHVSPQFHIIHDDNFETIINDEPMNHELTDSLINELFENSREVYSEAEIDSDGRVIYMPPPLDDIWLDEAERRAKRIEQSKSRATNRDRWIQDESPLYDNTTPPTPPERPDKNPLVSDSESDDDLPRNKSLSGESRRQASEGDKLPRRSTRLRRERNGARFMQYGDKCLPSEQYACTLGSKQPSTLARIQTKMQDVEAMSQDLNNKYGNFDLPLEQLFFANLDWEHQGLPSLLSSEIKDYIEIMDDYSSSGHLQGIYMNQVHPMILAAKSAASKDDNPTWWQAMNGPYSDQYFEAAKVEVMTLESKDSWIVVDRTDDMNVLPSTWAFKLKRFPDGSVKKFKGRFCARGDKQIQGIDFFETYSPVVQWTTIRLMLILECVLGLVSKQGDVTCAFLHAILPDNECVYIEMPLGFKQYDKQGRPRVLKLKRALYGLRQSPRAFWLHLTEKLECCGLKQSKLDPCLFFGHKVICIVYVDDLLFWSHKEESIIELAEQLRAEEIELEEEGDAAGFLGVQLRRDKATGHIHMTQEGLIKRIIEALGFDLSLTKPKGTPAERQPLIKDENGPPRQDSFNYASVVGMLLYLSGHTRPDLTYSVSQVARFMFSPNLRHENAIKMIGRYLVGTKDKGMILKPTETLNINAYPDADFAGLYGYEDNNDPVCVRSRTGFVITVANCPVLWSSKLQTETAMSTMEAEVIALANCCKELFPIMDQVAEIVEAVGMNNPDSPIMHVTIHEDNSGALVLATTLPPQFTPRSKYYAIKTVWFREGIIAKGVKVVAIETRLQLGDIFTKMPGLATFVFLRELLLGW